jgi:hypothetical protein
MAGFNLHNVSILVRLPDSYLPLGNLLGDMPATEIENKRKKSVSSVEIYVTNTGNGAVSTPMRPDSVVCNNDVCHQQTY